MKTTKEFLAEGSVINDKSSYAKIAALTDVNDHNAAMVEGAKLLGNKKLQKIFETIQTLHKIEGSMPQDLMKYRQYTYTVMMKEAKKKLHKDDYKLFYGAF